MKHWVAQALSLLMALCLFLPCFAAAEEAAQNAVTIDFEDGNAAAFSQSGSCTVGVTESQAHSGKQSLRVSGRGSNNWDAVDLSAASVGIEAGAKVHLSACVYVESSEDGVMAIGKAGGDYAYYAQVNVKGKEWTEISCDFEADAGVNIRFLTASDNYLGKNYCLDDVTLTIIAPEKWITPMRRRFTTRRTLPAARTAGMRALRAALPSRRLPTGCTSLGVPRRGTLPAATSTLCRGAPTTCPCR